MTLKEKLQNLEDTNVKVRIGGSESSSFIYCGSICEETYQVAKEWLDREVVDVYPSLYEPNTTIILFKTTKTQIGNLTISEANGRYWTEAEYLKKNKEKKVG